MLSSALLIAADNSLPFKFTRVCIQYLLPFIPRPFEVLLDTPSTPPIFYYNNTNVDKWQQLHLQLYTSN